MSPLPISRRYLVEALLFITYLVFGISWLAYAPIMPELIDFYGFSKAQGGSLISFVSLAKAFVPLFAGAIAARFGLKNSLLLGSGFAALAIAIPLLPNYQALVVGRFLFGMGGAIIVTLMGPIVMTWFPKEELPVVTGFNNVAVNTGITIATLTTLPLSQKIGWKATLVLFGALCAILAALWYALGGVGPIISEKDRAQEHRPSLLEVALRSETWWLALAFAGPLSVYLALNAWLPSHLEQAFGYSRAEAAGVSGIFNAVGIPVAIVSGFICKKLGKRRPLIIAAGLLLPISSWVLITTPNPALRNLAAILLGTGLFLYVAPLFTIPMELPGMDPAKLALTMGCVFSIAYSISFLSPVLTGLAADLYGSYAPGLKLFSLGSSLLALGGIMLPETGPAANKRKS